MSRTPGWLLVLHLTTLRAVYTWVDLRYAFSTYQMHKVHNSHIYATIRKNTGGGVLYFICINTIMVVRLITRFS